jgi:hypothetical protein
MDLMGDPALPGFFAYSNWLNAKIKTGPDFYSGQGWGRDAKIGLGSSQQSGQAGRADGGGIDFANIGANLIAGSRRRTLVGTAPCTVLEHRHSLEMIG